MSYAPGIAEGCCGVGIVIGKILKGDKPAELPVEQVANIEFIINLKTAKAPGLAFPPPAGPAGSTR
jgi:putative ABC transport system substrate-binding protein